VASGWTRANGTMILTLETKGIPTGAHLLRAYFYSPEPKYKDAVSELVTLIVYVVSNDENGDGGNDWWRIVTNNIFWILLIILIILIVAIMLLTRDTMENIRSGDLRKKPEVKLEESGASETPAEPVLPAPYSPITGQMHGIDISIAPPKIAIVKQYGIMLDSLKSRMIPALPNMTAREIGMQLQDRSYPPEDITATTRLFEKAMYSAEEISIDDWTAFRMASEGIIGFKGGAT